MLKNNPNSNSLSHATELKAVSQPSDLGLYSSWCSSVTIIAATITLSLFAPVFCYASKSEWKLISPSETVQDVQWTVAEKAAGVGNRTLFRDEGVSHHLIRLNRSEVPHTHPRRDLTLYVLAGRIEMHYAKKVVSSRQGDVIVIPRGQEHWAEVVGEDIPVVYAIFTEASQKKK